MAEGSGIGGFLTKTTGSLPNWAWGLVIVAGAGVGYYFVKKNNATSTNASTAVATPVTDTGPGVNNAPVDTSNPVLTVPGGTSGTVPILPPGYTPIYDSQGNLIGWEPPGTSPPTQTPPPAPTNGQNPLIPYGQLPAGNWVSGSHLNWQGQTYTVEAGAGGRLWGVPGNLTLDQARLIKNGVLLYAPPSYYH